MQRKLSFLVASTIMALSFTVSAAEDHTSAPANQEFNSATELQSDKTLEAKASTVAGAPTAEQMEKGRLNYTRYCADCHGKEGEGKNGPKLDGSLIVTGPVFGQIIIVLTGHSQSEMPAWGISELSDDLIASVITYQRNAWGNNNQKEYGKHAGGVVTPALIHEFRQRLKNRPVKQDIRT